MNDFDFYEEPELNWVTQQLKIAHLVNESRIKDKYSELSNFYIENDNYLQRHEKIHAKSLHNILKEISRLRIEVLYLEKDLGHIEDVKRNIILVTSTETSKMINSFQVNMENNMQKIYKLQKAIEKQRNDYLLKISEQKEEKKETIKDYDQIIADLSQEIRQAEIQLYSSKRRNSSKASSITASKQQEISSDLLLESLESSSIKDDANDFKPFLEMKSAESFLKSELEDSYESLESIQRKIEREKLNLEELKKCLNEIENISTNYREEISNLNDQHYCFMTKLGEMNQNRWNLNQSSSMIH